jgi:hypothetical protein
MEEKKGSSVAWQVFLGLFLFFVVLPLGTCVACTTCAGVGVGVGAALARDGGARR